MEFPLKFNAPVVMRPSDSTVMVESVVLQHHGSLDRISVQEAPLPKELDADDVEVEVHFGGLNFTDNYLRLGIIRNSRFPAIMGSECAGVVKRVGSSVSALQVGQLVLCLKMQGGLLRRVVHVPQHNCFPLPRDVSLAKAVGLGLDYLMAYVCLFEVGGLEENQTVFVQSIGGGVGTSTLQLAKTVSGVKVVGTASSHKHGDLVELGADLLFSPEVKYKEALLDVFPEGVDIVINSNGGSDVEECLQILKPFGKLILIGSNSTVTYPKTTTWGKRPVWDVKDIATSKLIANNHCIAGVNIGDFIETCPERTSEILNEIFDMHKKSVLSPVYDTIMHFQKVDVAFAHMCTRTNLGKILIVLKSGATRNPVMAVHKLMTLSRQPTKVERMLSEKLEQIQPELGKKDSATTSAETDKPGTSVPSQSAQKLGRSLGVAGVAAHDKESVPSGAEGKPKDKEACSSAAAEGATERANDTTC